MIKIQLVCVGVAALCLAAAFIIAPNRGSTRGDDAVVFLVAAIGCAAVGVLAILGEGIYFCLLLHRLWQVVQDGCARTTPGKAIGYCFIPFFNLYWFFVATTGLALELNRVLARRRIDAPPVVVGYMTTFIVLSFLCIWIPFAVIVLLIPQQIYRILALRSAKRAAVYIAEGSETLPLAESVATASDNHVSASPDAIVHCGIGYLAARNAIGDARCWKCQETSSARELLYNESNDVYVHRECLNLPADPATKACPQCAETIKAEAIVCRFCGHRFSETDVAVATEDAERAIQQEQQRLVDSRREEDVKELRRKMSHRMRWGWVLVGLWGLTELACISGYYSDHKNGSRSPLSLGTLIGVVLGYSAAFGLPGTALLCSARKLKKTIASTLGSG